MLPSQYRYVADRNAYIRNVQRDFEEGSFVILDTETTGLKDTDEIIQVAILDCNGQVLLDTLVGTTKARMPAAAEAVHGITKKDLKDAPGWKQVRNQIEEICRDRTVYIYNAAYDTRLIKQTCDNHDTDRLILTTKCAMLIWARVEGTWDEWRGDWKWHKLPGRDHSALGDCKATLALLRQIAETPCEPEPEPPTPGSADVHGYDFAADEEETKKYLAEVEHGNINSQLKFILAGIICLVVSIFTLFSCIH